MAQIDFRKKINWHRRYRSPQGVKTEHEILRIFESDRGRIINSPAIRRLQQKTQVFPLERNAAVRTRLTHSMEVQQVGRYIAKEILSRLKELKLLEAYGLDELTGTRHSPGAYIDADESHLGTGWRYFKIYSSGVVAW